LEGSAPGRASETHEIFDWSGRGKPPRWPIEPPASGKATAGFLNIRSGFLTGVNFVGFDPRLSHLKRNAKPIAIKTKTKVANRLPPDATQFDAGTNHILR
jgi:hypothetical protein